MGYSQSPASRPRSGRRRGWQLYRHRTPKTPSAARSDVRVQTLSREERPSAPLKGQAAFRHRAPGTVRRAVWKTENRAEFHESLLKSPGCARGITFCNSSLQRRLTSGRLISEKSPKMRARIRSTFRPRRAPANQGDGRYGSGSIFSYPSKLSDFLVG